jgi:serine protease AprX
VQPPKEKSSTLGEGVVWAVVDTGIHARHPHFRMHDNLTLEPPLRHRDFTAPTLEASASEMEALVDVRGNGTNAAGLIAGELSASDELSLVVDFPQRSADTTSSIVHATIPAVTGIAPRCKIVSLKVLDDSGYGQVSSVIEALEWVREG